MGTRLHPLGLELIVETFLRWVETARAGDRARAANALARAFLRSTMAAEERRAAKVAMTYLLDDPSPRVRLALAEALADSQEAPRPLMISLAEDQPEIASQVILRSPVLSQSDLVDLAGRGSTATRMLIAARPYVGRGLAAALAEIGDAHETVVLLENPTAEIARFTLKRIAERHGGDENVRALLLDRDDLPADARQLLVQHVTEALASFGLVRAAVDSRRIDRLIREAGASATITIAANVVPDELPALVEHLRDTGRLTPAFLMHALCSGRTDFFAAGMVCLSGIEERRVRSILATGRFHAVRALLETTGLPRDVSPVFVEAIMLWRTAIQAACGSEMESISARLIDRYREEPPENETARALLEMVEKLAIIDQRRLARDYATGLALTAA